MCATSSRLKSCDELGGEPLHEGVCRDFEDLPVERLRMSLFLVFVVEPKESGETGGIVATIQSFLEQGSELFRLVTVLDDRRSK